MEAVDKSAFAAIRHSPFGHFSNESHKQERSTPHHRASPRMRFRHYIRGRRISRAEIYLNTRIRRRLSPTSKAPLKRSESKAVCRSSESACHLAFHYHVSFMYIPFQWLIAFGCFEKILLSFTFARSHTHTHTFIFHSFRARVRYER